MYNFFILGQIPGTDIVISFTMWLQVVLVIAAIVTVIKYRRRQSEANTLLPTISND